MLEANTRLGFSGSYDPSDCWFLLKQIPLTRIDEQEAHVAGGLVGINHYREQLLREEAPSDLYFALYEGALHRQKKRLARDVMRQAACMAARSPQGKPIVIASLARAGSPFGALLVRALRVLGRADSVHYSISLIKKVGVDTVAVDYMLESHPGCTLWFTDGWTGKGGISRELKASVQRYNQQRGTRLSTGLSVVADLAGCADLGVTGSDYLIASAPLNAPMNGLVSRTVYNQHDTGDGELHGAMVYDHLAPYDRSVEFIDVVSAEFGDLMDSGEPHSPAFAVPLDPVFKMEAQHRSADVLAEMMRRFGTDNEDLIKHGLCEVVRAIQRRPMHTLLLRDARAAENIELRALALALGVDVVNEPSLQYECIGACVS